MDKPRATTFNYAIGMFGTSIPINMLKTFAFTYYVLDRGVTTEQWALMMLIYAFIDALDNPVYGFLSDRTRTRWGRRRPWLTIGTPLRIFTSFVTAVIGVICLASALQGRTFIRIGVVLRIGMAAAALLLIRPGMTTDIFGVGLAALILVIQKVKQRIDTVKSRKQADESKEEKQ